MFTFMGNKAFSFSRRSRLLRSIGHTSPLTWEEWLCRRRAPNSMLMITDDICAYQHYNALHKLTDFSFQRSIFFYIFTYFSSTAKPIPSPFVAPP
jgi:hypothetical protein